ncbi:ATP-binding cassette domain-containing protein [Leucobacter soli]|uniref:ATP-binding cassette domain-containing protein n=1 Tax=Leucobacter soli TaxID=2812850 RepID=UPI003612F972
MVPPVQSVSAAGRGRAPAATTWPALAPGPVWGIAILCALSGALAPAPWWQLGIVGAALAVCALAGRIGAPALRLGLWGAVLFVALRVAYRVIFTSTVAPPADALLLLDLPVIPLSGPFRGISLLGPLTLAQLLATLAEASRFAAVFVVFGAANALADVRTVLARAPRPLLPVATVLALALGTVPALLLAADRVSRAARMRASAEAPGCSCRCWSRLSNARPRSAPPWSCAASARSSPGTAGIPRPRPRRWPEPPEPVAYCCAQRDRRAAPGWGDSADDARGRGPRTERGELTILTGPTGSGKSTLLAALAGLAPAYTGGEASGTLEVAGRVVADRRPANLAGTVALVPQRVEHSFVAETVRGELAFALVHQGIAGDALAAAVERELERFDLVRLADRDPATLSAGRRLVPRSPRPACSSRGSCCSTNRSRISTRRRRPP